MSSYFKVHLRISGMRTQPPLRYMPQLDSLRAIAVFLVIISHWLHDSPINWLPNATMGVTLFFVLSGYLITKILFQSREAGFKAGNSRWFLMRQFYIRRALRIFPIYYLVLLVISLANVQGFREKALWFFAYAGNHYFFDIQKWEGVYSHLWTLAVEEQFYLFWPLAMLFIPHRYLRIAIWGAIFMGPICRAIIQSLGYELGLVLMPATMDSFGLGALLAWSQVYGSGESLSSKPWLRIGLGLSGLIIAVLAIWPEWAGNEISLRLAFSVIFVWLIEQAADGFTGKTGRFLEWPRLIWLGKISYGLYLFHNFIPYGFGGLTKLFRKMGIEIYFTDLNPYLMFPIYGLVLVILSQLSWTYFESPINDLKRHFPYKK